MSSKQVVGNRRSIRFFEPYQPVEREKVQKVLEAARLQSQHGDTIDMAGWDTLKDQLMQLLEVGALSSSYGWSEQFIDDIVMKTPDFNVMAGDRTFAEWLTGDRDRGGDRSLVWLPGE
jgi:hypothetical protein